MICPVCGRKFSFFSGSRGGGAYCSPECADRAVKDLEALLDRMEREEESTLEQDEE